MKMGLLTAYGISTDCTGGMKMKKVWYVLSVSLLLTALILGGAFSATANTTNAGSCGDEATWSYADGVLTIVGEGAMSDYSNNAPWAELEITSVVIGEDITAIGATAFSGLGELETVTLEDGSKLAKIGKGAFYNCASLTGIAIPYGVREIGEWAFYGCAALAEIDFCGTQAEWDAVEKGDSWNVGAGACAVNYLHELQWEYVDVGGHQRMCTVCGETMSERHDWEKISETPATHTEDGEVTYKCKGCQKEVTETIPANVDQHVYGEWVEVDGNTHKRVCACGNAEETEVHHWDNGTVTTASTHMKEGVKTYLCTDCGSTKTEVIEKTGHVYNILISVDENEHKLVCACGDEQESHEAHNFPARGTVKKQATHTEYGLMAYTCACGETRVELIGKTGTHTYATYDDEYEDATQHKKVCACGHAIYEDHAWGEGEVTKDATHTELGETTYTCACGQEKVEANIAKTTEHSYSTGWMKCDATQHKKVCACGEAEYEDHNWDDGDVIKQQTHVTDGSIKYICEDCGETKTVTVPAGHAYGAWAQLDANEHQAVCDCGHTTTAAHQWDEGEITTPATHTTKGEKTYTCVCGETKTEDVATTAEHSYGEWTDHNKDQHKKVCACGDVIYSVHQWEVSTVQPTHTKDGEIRYTCSDCGKTNSQKIDKLSEQHSYGDWTKLDDDQHKKVCACGDEIVEEHAWDKGEVVSEATAQAEGKMKYVCKDCGCEKTEAIPMLDGGAETGCGATVAGGAALMLLLSVGSVALVYRKKED